jgi:hypothetical protein
LQIFSLCDTIAISSFSCTGTFPVISCPESLEKRIGLERRKSLDSCPRYE